MMSTIRLEDLTIRTVTDRLEVRDNPSSPMRYIPSLKRFEGRCEISREFYVEHAVRLLADHPIKLVLDVYVEEIKQVNEDIYRLELASVGSPILEIEQ